MALDVEQVVKVPVISWIIIDTVEYEITSLQVEYSADRAAASISLAMGIPLHDGAKPQVTESQAKAFGLDKLVEVWVKAESNVILPGLPIKNTLLMKGYIVDSGPWRAGGVGNEYSWGIEILHQGIADLSTGSTGVWPLTTSVNFDWKRPVSAFEGLWMSSSQSGSNKTLDEVIEDDGVWPTLRNIFLNIAKGPQNNSSPLLGELSESKCLDSEVGTNNVAVQALEAVAIAKDVVLKVGASDISRFATFIDQMITNDLRTMSFLQQIQALGDQCFFRLVPKADGTLLVVPFQTFDETPKYVFGSDEIFNVRPASVGDPRVSGVLLYGTPITVADYENTYGIYGCYVFGSDTTITASPRGVLQAMPAPSWLGAASNRISTQSRENFEATVETSTPDANAVPESPADSYGAVLSSYGNEVAREWSRQYRFRGSSAAFETYLRTDLGPHSTVKLVAPSTLDGEAAIFGKIDKVIIMIDSTTREAKTGFSLAYARNEEIQENIGTYEHPIYSDGNYDGQAL